MSQGANPWSDLGCREALRLLGRYLRRAVEDATDREAREQTMGPPRWRASHSAMPACTFPMRWPMRWRATWKSFRPSGIPAGRGDRSAWHGGRRECAFGLPLHRTEKPRAALEAAALLGRDVSGTSAADAGEVLGNTLSTLMKKTHIPERGSAHVGA